jgi:hypothetical protein
MFPSNPSVYPEFVADQLLTAHDLNELFGYLDEQGRMTRTNLIGIGIVCGLQVQVNAAQTEITITKGVGVTSEGYLISVPTTTYSKSVLYDSKIKEKTYDKFVHNGPPKSNKFNIWQLRPASVDPDAEDLTPEFLDGKIVLIFVELLEVGNKNCDPNSCDDKGKHYEVNLLPMVVDDTNAASLITSMGSTITADTFTGLPEIRMRRFDVPNTNPVTSEDIFEAYQSVLNTSFLTATENALTQSYSVFSVFINNEFPTNPFTGLAGNFAFINNGTITADQLKHIQYYYDLFSDFLQAYNEFKRTGEQIMSACCPDASLFPRHILLGEAIPLPGNVKSSYRHYFIYSPLFEQKNLLNELKSLFKRLVLFKEKFFLPPVNSGPPSSKTDPYIRITPSLLEDTPLSKKAIPYYYNPVSGPTQLYKFWNYEKTAKSKPQWNLSYNANQYNVTDDFIVNPLKYDLEPYNFLRIEGIIGKPYAHVLKNIKRLITENRLPFDVIVLNTDVIQTKGTEVLSVANAGPSSVLSLLGSESSSSSNSSLSINTSSGNLLSSSSPSSSSSSGNLSISINSSSLAALNALTRDSMEAMCHFQDLEAMYAAMKNEMICTLCKELKYYYDLRYDFNSTPNTGAAAAADVASVVGLFNNCSPGYIVKRGTFGFLIEKVYKLVGNDGNITIQVIADALDIENILSLDLNGDGVPDINSPALASLIGFIVNMFAVPIYIIRLANTFTDRLSTFDVERYCAMHKLLSQNAGALKFAFNMVTAADKQSLRAAGTNAFNPDVTVNTTAATGTGTTAFASGTTNTGTGNINRLSVNSSLLGSLSTTQSSVGRMLLLMLLLEDFFDHLDALIYNCKCSAFKALKAEYEKRLAYLTRLRQFGYFTKLHPGIQHKAGVPMGGTFIIVYHSRGSGTSNGTFAVTGVVLALSGAPIPGAIISASPLSATITSSTGQFKLVVTALPVTLSVIINGVTVKEVVVTSQQPVTIVVGAQDNDTDIAESVVDSIPEGTVIADFYLPYRCCSDCPPIQYVINERPPSVPSGELTVNAGTDQEITLPVSQIRLNGSATTGPDNTVTSFFWVVLTGPQDSEIEIITPNSAQTDVLDLDEGVYKFELTATDNAGNIARDIVEVKVNPAIRENLPPVANAGNDIVVTLSPNSLVVLDGSASSDPDNSPLDYSWEQINPSSAPAIPAIISRNLDKTGIQNLVPGVYEFKLTVKNRFGLTSEDTVKVTAEEPPNKPPVANAGGNITVSLPVSTATLDGSKSSDEDGVIKEFAWTFDTGPNTPTIANATFAVTSVSGLIPGIYKFKLTVKDDDGDTHEDIATITVVGRDVQVKTCSEFPKVVELFTKFPDIDQNNFGKFREFFRAYDEEIAPLFEKFGPGGSTVTNLSTDKQIDFFADILVPVKNAAGATVNLSLPDALQKWLQELNDLVVVRSSDPAAVKANKNLLRLQVLALYRVLLQLVTYIICIQKEDFNEARIPMDGVMKIVQAHIADWSANIGQFKTAELDMVGFIGDDLKGEEKRVNNNGEATVKVKYLEVLKKIIQEIDSIP